MIIIFYSMSNHSEGRKANSIPTKRHILLVTVLNKIEGYVNVTVEWVYRSLHVPEKHLLDGPNTCFGIHIPSVEM